MYFPPSIPSAGTRINDMLGSLGIKGGMIGAQIDALMGNPLGMLQNLRDAYQETAMGRGTSGFERTMMQGGMCPMATPFAPSMMMPMMRPVCGGGYGGVGGFQQVDMAPGMPNNPSAPGSVTRPNSSTRTPQSSERPRPGASTVGM